MEGGEYAVAPYEKHLLLCCQTRSIQSMQMKADLQVLGSTESFCGACTSDEVSMDADANSRPEDMTKFGNAHPSERQN